MNVSGTIPLSGTQQFDVYGEPLSGGQLYIIAVGTVSTPQDAFQDPGLTIKMPYPMTLDAAGRINFFYLADGFVKIRLQDSHGVVQLAADSVMVIGPSTGGGGGGGGGGTIDPTTIYQTGDIKPRYSVGAHTGWVRANGLTIGSATSGATERANLDCQSLFQHLWGADTSLAVSGGRGASAAADWTANKQIATPDFRGYGLTAPDGMGNALAGRLTTAFFGAANSDLLGAVGGAESRALAVANLPPYTPAGTITDGPITVTQNASNRTSAAASDVTPGSVQGTYGAATITASQTGTTFAGTAQGGSSAAFAAIGPRKLCTFYMKL